MIITDGTSGVTGPIANFLLSLYPSRWRERYEGEFRDVLEQCPLSLALVTDVSMSALVAHITYGREARRVATAHRARCRRAVIAAILLLRPSPLVMPSHTPRPYRPLDALFP